MRVEKHTETPKRRGYPGHGEEHRGSTEVQPTSSGSDRDVEAEDEARARGKSGDKKVGGCCSVNVTTAFVPHTVRTRTGSIAAMIPT